MCTALRRVRGTLLRRGPCVMDGQLLLGTRPALQRQTHTQMHKHHCADKQHRVDVMLQRVAAADTKTSTVAWSLRKWKKNKQPQQNNIWSRAFWPLLSSHTTLPVYFWRFAFDFGTLLHHLFCHSSTVIKHRDDAQDEFRIHAHRHITRQPGVTQCHESHHCSGWAQCMSIMIELTWWIQLCVAELAPVRQMHTDVQAEISKQWPWLALQQ